MSGPLPNLQANQEATISYYASLCMADRIDYQKLLDEFKDLPPGCPNRLKLLAVFNRLGIAAEKAKVPWLRDAFKGKAKALAWGDIRNCFEK